MTSSPRVTVFGSLHYDIAVFGPARPRKGETVTGSAWHPKSGGKGGNQAVSAAKTGIATSMIGAVAQDEFGHFLLDNLARKGVDHRFVARTAQRSTGMSVAIFDDEGDYGAVIVSGSNLELSDTHLDAASEILAETSILVLQNEVPDAANVAAARRAKAAGALVLLNAAPARTLSDALKTLVDILVVNAIEAEMLAGVDVVETLDGALSAARILKAGYPQVVVTAGGAGVAAVDKDGHEITIEPVKVSVESTHGAGDEFIGMLAAQTARGATLEVALAEANKAAAKLVATPEAER
ncbi:PfkB family carbohydrate kinase [Rhizobium sp. NFR03]|uniref:PfkB family carbohydrate kinase n=1 Tax=Rhizobium sp. NFR03 TaxID=1566263 RepID=UPI0008CC4F95|nr:PfkB family carbohydrate kinase [Rhizobium sp. NFR03]SES46111.1 ribokinase [Rhizobium sp. NFR03]